MNHNKLLKSALYLLKETRRVEVVSLKFDDHKSNIAMCEILGCSFDPDNFKTSFTYEDYTIPVVLDPCHLIKLVRNAFEAYREFKDLDGNFISWNLIEQLHFIHEKEGFHHSNKLTKEHIHFNNKIMRVKLATLGG
ncbi:unnamed protein product [Euphydryas editha]|uniref:Transposable element P transposase-like GTP-binding insertion domain-containing protein n=1 Tax=Euphydryas editha TaxID=104508 RepID=A0AAU9TRI9_EUPED|nr:unnamed protein product [Euphydryas editha]